MSAIYEVVNKKGELLEREEFEVDQEVYWTSQSNGRETRKQGVIVYAGRPLYYGRSSAKASDYNLIPEEVQRASANQLKFDKVGEGVIVRVESEGKKPRYYSPRLKNLRRV